MEAFLQITAQTPVLLNRWFGFEIDPAVDNLIKAILIFVLGWIIAIVTSSLIGGLLKRTNVDNRLATWITGRNEPSEQLAVEKLISSLIFWTIMLLVLVAILDLFKLTVVSQPLNTLLNQVLGFLPKIGAAIALLAIAWGLATVSKLVLTRVMTTFRLDERLQQQVGEPRGGDQLSISETLGNAIYWFIFLLFLPSILSTLELQGTLQPVQNLLNQILSSLPFILQAILIGVTGWLVAQVVRRIVSNLLAASGVDRLGSRFGLRTTTGSQPLSWIIGTLVYVLILIPTAISALRALRIDAISDPATSMLEKVLTTIPQILTAGLILAIAYFLGKFVADLVTDILTGIGFNHVFEWLGLRSPKFVETRTPPQPTIDPTIPGEGGQATILQSPAVPPKTPSELAGIAVLVGIMLFATVGAIDVLQIPALTSLFTGIVVILGRILGGLVVLAIGLYLANLAFTLIDSSGSRQARTLAQVARISIIAFVLAMALQQMGIASNIVNLAFGLLLGAIAVAIALSFGLGSREIAAEQVREWLASFKSDRF
ncbi:mechanosensitive ion channel [Merismopedia glauca]|uniref:Uncharacterized protein n=1 Tax=Merismopedia glauca CCAP 1448/3 TaxID=1296344 RepID=A0A2T1C4Y3_9CYAN|nr:mechanosensitive ion channel [Merismopedia glauca]PSB03173.1 hypothetical protein C7B64_09840 [Merismopedia glauca CCAP 1448/3]